MISMLSITPPYSIQVTGADSIAAMLSVNCTLTSLNLGWNSIRMASAVTVAESLRNNHTLRSLGLAYNSFSDFASQVTFRGSYAGVVFLLGSERPNCDKAVPYYHARYLLKYSTPHALATHHSRTPIASNQRLCCMQAFYIVALLTVTPRVVFRPQTLAVALSQNDTLTSLDLSYNSVSPAAAIVLAFALKVWYARLHRRNIILEHPFLH